MTARPEDMFQPVTGEAGLNDTLKRICGLVCRVRNELYGDDYSRAADCFCSSSGGIYRMDSALLDEIERRLFGKIPVKGPFSPDDDQLDRLGKKGFGF